MQPLRRVRLCAVAPRVGHADELALAVGHPLHAALGQVDKSLRVDRLVRVVHLEGLARAGEVVREQAVVEEARRVHKGRDRAAELVIHHAEDLGHGGLAALVLGQVAFHGAHAHPMRDFELRPGAGGRLVVAAVREHAVEALGREAAGRGKADPSRAARDDRDVGCLSAATQRVCTAKTRRVVRDNRGQAARQKAGERKHASQGSCARRRHREFEGTRARQRHRCVK